MELFPGSVFGWEGVDMALVEIYSNAHLGELTNSALFPLLASGVTVTLD